MQRGRESERDGKREARGRPETLVGVRVVVGLRMGNAPTHAGGRETRVEGDVSDRIGGGVGELDNHQNSRRYLRESRERTAPVTTADCIHEVSTGLDSPAGSRTENAPDRHPSHVARFRRTARVLRSNLILRAELPASEDRSQPAIHLESVNQAPCEGDRCNPSGTPKKRSRGNFT